MGAFLFRCPGFRVQGWVGDDESEDGGGAYEGVIFRASRDNRRGIPQGSPISPLLAHLYMRRFVLGWKMLGLERSLGSRQTPAWLTNRGDAVVNTDAKKTVLRMIPYGFYVLTADDGAGNLVASTVNWVTQNSFAPPLVAVGIKADSRHMQGREGIPQLCAQHARQGSEGAR
jgi:hypothetical protein